MSKDKETTDDIFRPRIGCPPCRVYSTTLVGAVLLETGICEGAWECRKCKRVYIIRWDPADQTKYVRMDVRTGRKRLLTMRECERILGSRPGRGLILRAVDE